MTTQPQPSLPAQARTLDRLAIVGAGRMGSALAGSLGAAALDIEGPLRRGELVSPYADAVLLCVPDGEITAAAAALPFVEGRLVGHTSAATTLAALAPHEAFSLHPLMTVTPAGASFAGATAAVAGSTPHALAAAEQLALSLGMRPVHVADEDRAAYHAAASIASNFLVTLGGLAEQLAGGAGVERERLVALVEASVANWALFGARSALTGPIARGDEVTVARQRAAVAERLPAELALFDALADATRRLAGRPPAGSGDVRALAAGNPTRAGGRMRPSGGDEHDGMRTVRTVAGLRAALADARRAGRTIGLVPTMGALHDGHLALIRQARAACDAVVVSLFVNPTQFDESADLAAYPRDEQRDARLAAAAGADLLFAPGVADVYPDGFATTVRVDDELTGVLEGAQRGAAHFAGVATVVAKLLNVVQPDVAFFGQKDAQQVAVVRRLVRDLDIPARIAVGATVREPDGLALSSRNARLTAGDRARAVALHRGLEAIAAAHAAGEHDARALRAIGRAAMAGLDVEPEYLELVDPTAFTPVTTIAGEPVLVAVAARVGDVRLIDNTILNGSHA